MNSINEALAALKSQPYSFYSLSKNQENEVLLDALAASPGWSSKRENLENALNMKNLVNDGSHTQTKQPTLDVLFSKPKTSAHTPSTPELPVVSTPMPTATTISAFQYPEQSSDEVHGADEGIEVHKPSSPTPKPKRLNAV